MSLVCFILGFVCIVGLNFARRSEGLAITLLFAAGLSLGLGMGGVLDDMPKPLRCRLAGRRRDRAVRGGVGSIGYSIRKDLSGGYRVLFVLLLALIVFGFVGFLVSMPNASIIYALAGLVIFGGYTVLDFNRMRRAGMEETVPLAAGIFLDILNIFLFFLRLFGGRS